MPRRRAFLIASAGLVLTGCTTSSLFSSVPPPGNAVDETAAVLPMINALRQKHGLSTLSEDKAAIRAARDQADRMASHGEMEHNIGFGADFTDRMNRMGVRLQAAENIAEGQATPDRAFEAWVNSPKHLENMLGPYKGLGVAVAESPASQHRPYWSMVLSS